jgi:hypothetical protein
MIFEVEIARPVQGIASSCFTVFEFWKGPQLLVQYTRSFILYQEVVATFLNLRMCHALTRREALNIGHEVMTELPFKKIRK